MSRRPTTGAGFSLPGVLDGRVSALLVPAGFAGGGGIQIDWDFAPFLLPGLVAGAEREEGLAWRRRRR